jgi:putative nucleotidyltransferase with HDIG domain
MGLAYRVQQFFRVLSAHPDAAEIAHVSEILEAQLTKLFLGMSPSDQAHALRVLSALQIDGKTDPDLLAAALLHDVGKSVHRPSVLDRIVVVLANLLFPRKVVQWGESEPMGWSRPFSIAAQHARWGAELAAAHGASPRLIELIQRHQDLPANEPYSSVDRLLLDLRWADSEN